MDTNTLYPTVAAATFASAHAGNHNLSTYPKRMAVIKVWDSMMRRARKYCEQEGFVTVHNMPHIVGVTGACENTDTLFPLDWYDGDGKKMFLPRSNQRHIEMLTQAVEGGRVCGEIQRFRKERNADNRRLAQFTLFKIEHLGDLDELLDHLAGIVRTAANEVATKCAKELALFGRTAEDIKDLTFKRMTYTDAIERLKLEGFPDLQWGDDLGVEEENRLTELEGPIFITHYPVDIKFFNVRNNDEDPCVVNSPDLLLPLAGESAGSAEREFDGAKLRHKLGTSSMLAGFIRQGMKLEDFEWYLDFYDQHDVKLHSGAGVGMARVAQFILGQTDIRECVPLLTNRDNVI